VPQEKIHFVGNVMIDTLLRHRSRAKESTILSDLQLSNGGSAKPFAILTLHRPSNVDDRETFSRMLQAFLEISKRMPIIFPAHPRTLKRIQEPDLADYFVDHFMEGPEPWDSRVRIRLVPPLGYLDFLSLMSEAKVVLTDSGGIQEETTILGVPCITLRESTERPVTLEDGTNVLVGSSPERIVNEFIKASQGRSRCHSSPKYWDGNAAKRILKVLFDDFCLEQSLRVPHWDTGAKPNELSQN
jgi:UDP-N-acetylglucosamine 2-epimerase (non-hydrolysing)